MINETTGGARPAPIEADPASGHAGDVAPGEAWRALARTPRAAMVDVRTRAEWAFVGTPDLDALGRPLHRIEWQSFPTGAPNPDFLGALAGALPDRTAPILFICRSGARSAAAARAATQAGYEAAYNVADGFEGPHDACGRRGLTAGWKAEGLAWTQP